jgi:hypothetical protein
VAQETLLLGETAPRCSLAGLRQVNAANKERVRQRIQERYLFRYSKFLRVEAGWGSSGIWGISSPGSYGATPNYSYEHFDLPKRVVQRFEKWQRLYDARDPLSPSGKRSL